MTTTTTLLLGDCVDVMRTMPDRSVHTCVTSPPYFGLRDYGTARWEGGDPACDHRESTASRTAASMASSTLRGGKGNTHRSLAFKDECGRCGARRADGQIGLERTPEEFVAKMVDVFRAVRRVLRDDGTLWLNLGDSYSGGGGFSPDAPSNATSLNGRRNQPGNTREYKGRTPTPGLKQKDLIGIPWRVAFALQADGWYLRSDIIWHKPNPMPESVRDRPTKSHEYLFLLSKSVTYHYDADAIKEDASSFGRQHTSKVQPPKVVALVESGHHGKGGDLSINYERQSRNRRSVWTVATRPFKGAHFATFPPKLIEPCILAGTSEAGCCPECGKPWERVVERVSHSDWRERQDSARSNGYGRGDTGGPVPSIPPPTIHTLGFRPACSCDAGDAVPCTVLDPFNGAGTTGVVAQQHGRSYVGIDLNPEYLALSRARLRPAHAVA